MIRKHIWVDHLMLCCNVVMGTNKFLSYETDGGDGGSLFELDTMFDDENSNSFWHSDPINRSKHLRSNFSIQLISNI